MTERIATKLSDAAASHGIIEKNDYELYIYSYQIMIERLVSWGSILLFSLAFGTFPCAIVFTMFYGFLRTFIGGWHASSFGACFAVSLGTYAVFFLVAGQVVKLIPMWVLLAVIAACGFVVLWLGPIAHPNKPMERKQLQKCYVASCWVVAIEILISIAFYQMNLPLYLTYALFSFLSISVSLASAHLSFKHGE